MNQQEIADYLVELGYSVDLDNSIDCLVVEIRIAGRLITLDHFFPAKILKLPRFLLRGAAQYGTLAHVELISNSTYANVCVNDPDSVSINYEVPPLAYAASLERHIELLTRVMTDPDWNRSELIREFRSSWDVLCFRAGTNQRMLYVAYDPGTGDECQIKGPVPKMGLGIPSHSLALGATQFKDDEFGSFRKQLMWERRPIDGKTVLLQLHHLDPTPADTSCLGAWFVSVFSHICPASQGVWQRARKQRSRVFWVLCTAMTESGRIWFAVRLGSNDKSKLPTTTEEIAAWSIEPIPVRGLDRDSVVPRGGGRMDLTDKSVLLIGCGSVGSEMAHRLASTGIGKMTLSDPESFSQDNLYRHTLAVDDIGLSKSFCLAFNLRKKYPWIRVACQTDRLEEFTDVDGLNQFDLILVAVGAPTVERQFAQFVSDSGVNTPIVNVWLEAYGVGGHAILSLPNSPGCLFCAYVDPDDFSRGLVSNLNFLSPNQNVTRSNGGCGNLFVPYSAIASNYTATIAADLAVQCLSGAKTTSSKISWKGSAAEATAHGLTTTYRYNRFTESLEVLPLHHPECDACAR